MRRAQLLVVLGAFVLALVPFAFFAEQAEATSACCRIRSNGTVNVAGSFRCNLAVAETRRLGVGIYEVDFTPLSSDVRGTAKSATPDTQTTGSLTGEIGVADRAGDTSSVFVQIRSNTGAALDAGFDLCVHRPQSVIIIQ